MENESEKPLFQGIDEFERTYAPGGLSADDPANMLARVEGDLDPDARDSSADLEPPSAAPVGAIGTSPSGMMAPPNIGHRDHGGAPGDPQTEAEYPMGDDSSEPISD